MSLPPKVQAGMSLTGGRHYAGPGLGQPPAWTCGTCNTTHQTPVADGCPQCIAATAELRTAEKPMAPPPEPALHRAEFAPSRQPAVPGNRTPPQSPLLAAATAPKFDTQALLEAIDDRIRQALTEAIGAVQASAGDEGGYQFTPAQLYTLTLGLQLVLAAQDANPGVDPYLPVRESVVDLLATLQANVELQAYVRPTPEELLTLVQGPPDEPPFPR